MEQDKIASARDGAYIAGALPYIEADIQRLLKAIDHRAAANHPMTPELALILWTERNAYLTLLKKLKQRVEVGISQGKQVQKELEF